MEGHGIVLGLLRLALVVAIMDCGGKSQTQPALTDGSCKVEDGSVLEGDCLYCPPARTDLNCLPRRTWARDPRSGVCCEYDRPCASSFGWLTYPSATECNPAGCACDLASTGSQPLACGCPLAEGCPTLSETLKAVCSTTNGNPVIETRGCGKIQLSFEGGFSGWQSTFDEQSGAMIGRNDGGDQQDGACLRFGYAFGEEFACDTVKKCARCAEYVVEGAAACSD